MIIGIVGTLGAGKGTVVEYLKTKGFVHYSVSGYMGEVLEERDLPKKREHLSALADEFAEQYHGGMLQVMYEKAQTDGVSDFILESIHRESEAAYIKSIGGVLLGVTADPRVRYERTQLRQESEKDQVTFKEFQAAIDREEKGLGEGTPNINAVLVNADHVFENNGALEELHEQIDAWLEMVS